MFNGTLFTIGGSVFPLKWIYKESYTVTPHHFDLDSTRDANGILQRNVLNHKSCTVKFQLKPMTFDEYEEVWAFIRSKYNNAIDRDVNATYYNFETGRMEEMHAYLAEMTHKPDIVVGRRGLCYQTELEWIGY